MSSSFRRTAPEIPELSRVLGSHDVQVELAQTVANDLAQGVDQLAHSHCPLLGVVCVYGYHNKLYNVVNRDKRNCGYPIDNVVGLCIRVMLEVSYARRTEERRRCVFIRSYGASQNCRRVSWRVDGAICERGCCGGSRSRHRRIPPGGNPSAPRTGVPKSPNRSETTWTKGSLIFIAFISMVIFGGVGAYVASEKHRRWEEGLIFGFVLGPFGVIVLVMFTHARGQADDP